MSVVFDEYGRPFVVIREQEKRERLKGLDAQKANILAARTVCNILKTSLGPKGMDKILVSPDGDVTVTNDGATILDRMHIDHQIGRLLVQLSKSQDSEIGDGTTGVVVLAGALLEQAEKLLAKGVHAVQIAQGFEEACSLCVTHLETICDTVPFSATDHSSLLRTAMTTLSSKIVNKHKEGMARVAVEAVLCVADLDRKDVNLELIKVVKKVGGALEDTELVRGVVVDKDFSHGQMRKEVKNAKVCILTCPFEPPKPKTKHKLDITSKEDYALLFEKEQRWFVEMVAKVKSTGCNVVFCQWGFDDEANHLLLKNGINAVRWVGGVEVELLALATGANIVPRFEDLDETKLGTADRIYEKTLGTNNDTVIIVENNKDKVEAEKKTVTVVVRASNEMVATEAERSLHDAMCVVRNLVKDNRVVYGGGSCETSMSLLLDAKADEVAGMEQYAFRAFSEGLVEVCLVLADNAGFKPMQTVSQVKARQTKENNCNIGIDCMNTGIQDMKKQRVFETLIGKQQQLLLATQLVKMILKIDDVLSPGN